MLRNSLFDCIIEFTSRMETTSSSSLHFMEDGLFVSKQTSENIIIAKEVPDTLPVHSDLLQIFDR